MVEYMLDNYKSFWSTGDRGLPYLQTLYSLLVNKIDTLLPNGSTATADNDPVSGFISLLIRQCLEPVLLSAPNFTQKDTTLESQTLSLRLFALLLNPDISVR